MSNEGTPVYGCGGRLVGHARDDRPKVPDDLAWYRAIAARWAEASPDEPFPSPYSLADWCDRSGGTWTRHGVAPFEGPAAEVLVVPEPGARGRCLVWVRDRDGARLECSARRPEDGRRIADLLLSALGWTN